MAGDPLTFSSSDHEGDDSQPTTPAGRAGDKFVKPELEGYDIDCIIGRGGMGEVWRARQHGTGQAVALKVMNPDRVVDDDSRLRFQREIELAASLDHPNIARVYASPVHQGIYSYAMTFIDGKPLDEHAESAELTLRPRIELMRTVCLAMQHAHQRRVIHCDLKPSNILVTPDGCPYVVDFGLAVQVQALDATADSQGSSGRQSQLAGTLAYMAPEQADKRDDQPLDTRSDVYSLGVILYRLLTGCLPHDPKGTIEHVCQKILHEPIRPPHELAPKINGELSAVVMKALEKQPEQRYASAGELAHDLENFLEGEPVNAVPHTAVYLLGKFLKRYRLPLTVAALVITTVIALVAVGMYREYQLRLHIQDRAEAYRQALYRNTISLAQLAIDHEQYGRAADLLASPDCPADLHHWEWGYLRQRLDQSVLTLHEHSEPLLVVAVDGTGQTLITADQRQVIVRHARTGQLIHVYPLGADGLAHAVTIDPDGRYLAYTDDAMVVLLDLTSGQTLATLPIGVDPVVTLALQPALGTGHDRQALAVGYDDRVELWDVKQSRPDRVIRTDSGRVRALAFSTDGRYLVVGGRRMNESIFDQPFENRDNRHGWVECRDLKQIDTPIFTAVLDATVESLACSPIGSTLVAGGWDQVQILDHQGRTVKTLATNGSSLAYSRNGDLLATGGLDSAISFWDSTDEYSPLAVYRGHLGQINDLAFAPDGKRLFSGDRGGNGHNTVKGWDVTGMSNSLTDHTVPALAVSPDGRWVAMDTPDHTFEILETHSGRVLRHPPESDTTGAAMNPDTAVFSRDGQWLICVWSSHESKVTIWDIDHDNTAVLTTQPHRVKNPAFSPDGQQAAWCVEVRNDQGYQEDRVEVWGISAHNTWQRLHSQVMQQQVWSLAWSSDGRKLLYGGQDKWVYLWEMKKNQPPKELFLCPQMVTSVAVLPEVTSAPSPGQRQNPVGGTAVVADAIGQLYLIDLGRGRLVRSFEGHPERLAFSLDGRMLAVGGNGTVTIFDTQTGLPIHPQPLRGHEELVTALVFSLDGKRLFTAGSDASIKVWVVEGGTELLSLSGLGQASTRLMLTGHDENLLCVGQFGAIHVWRGGWVDTAAPSPSP